MPTLSLETIVRVRQEYIEGKPVKRIIADNEITSATVYLCVAGGPLDEQDKRPFPQLPLRRDVVGQRRNSLKGKRISLVARLWRTAERQVRGIEKRLALKQHEPAERERDTRMLAILVKTLRELSAFDAAHADPEPPGTEDDDIGPRDIDEFRRDLARRMDAIVAQRADPISGGS